MKRNLLILSAIGLILLLGAAIYALVWYNRPLGPSLALQVPTQAEPAADADAVQPVSTAAAVARSAADQPAASPQKTCGNTGVMRLLVHGRSTANDREAYGSDAVRLVVIDFGAPSASILALPVSLWVHTPALAAQGIDQTVLNLVYQTAWKAASAETDLVREQIAIQALAQTVVDNFGFVPDHYLTIREAAIIEFIDEVGGIEVTLDEAVDGTREGYGVYPAGSQVYTGQETLNLVRLMHPAGQKEADIWGGLSRQDAVLRGMQKAALDPRIVPKIPGLVRAIRKAIITDLSVDQAMDLACMVQEVGSDADMLSIGPDLVKKDDQGRMIPDVAGIKALIAKMAGDR